NLYEHAPAACHDYNPRAADVAARIKDAITAHLPDVAVEHIGSTAVAGCAGKGVVDLMILYEGARLEEVKALLDALGFQRQTTRDPFPEERPMRAGAIEHEGKTFRIHAHVISADSEEAAGLRKFRDSLRSDPELLADYVARKRAIIESGVVDPVDYSEMKDGFIKEAMGSKSVAGQS
ncbi:MAG TPA: GrpB family protein, partial [Blastocatellia bacterium]|nr:GrpB family protein [Blastocatellia bacterium]